MIHSRSNSPLRTLAVRIRVYVKGGHLLKHLRWVLSLAMVAVMMLSMIPSAVGMTAEEWNAQCTTRTIKNTTVYRPDAAGNKTQVATIPEGSYVKQNGFDNASQMWNVTFLTSNGSTAWGLVAADSLSVASVSITLDNGEQVDIPQELSENLDAVAAYLNQTHKDAYYTVSGTDGMIHVGDASERPDVDNTKMEVPEGYETAHTEDAYSDEETSSETADAESSEETTTASADATETDNAAQSETKTADSAAASATKEKVDYHKVLVLGTKKSIATVNGAQTTIDTDQIDFGTEVDLEEQLGIINAPKSGVATLLAEARKGAAELGKLKHGTVIGVIRKGKQYTRVWANGMEGLVLNSVVKTISRDAYAMGTGTLTYNGAVVNNQTINIRSSASNSARVLENWPTGLEVTIWSKASSFYEIEANGLRAYVNEKFLTFGERANIPVQTTTKKSGGTTRKTSSGRKSTSSNNGPTAPASTTNLNPGTSAKTTTNTTTPSSSGSGSTSTTPASASTVPGSTSTAPGSTSTSTTTTTTNSSGRTNISAPNGNQTTDTSVMNQPLIYGLGPDGSVMGTTVDPSTITNSSSGVQAPPTGFSSITGTDTSVPSPTGSSTTSGAPVVNSGTSPSGTTGQETVGTAPSSVGGTSSNGPGGGTVGPYGY